MNVEIIDKKMFDFSICIKKREEKENICIKRSKQEYEDSIDKPILLPLFCRSLSGLIISKENRIVSFTCPVVLDERYILFAIMNNNEKICFDMKALNEANEWDIVNYNSKFVITKTLSSYLNNKFWAWIDRGRLVWAEEFYID